MTDFARLVLDADTRGLKQGERDLESLQRQSAQTAREVDSGASTMGGAFKRVGVALVAAGIGNVIFDFGKKSAQAAIDAQEMGSAFEVVFGGMASDVAAWAEETGNALGRSTQEIQRGALAFQQLFGKALNPEQSAELSKQFALLTQDLASFYNLANDVAQQKLFAGLIGEAEPLRAVGVTLSENAFQARAAAMGLGDFSKELTDQEKIVVRAAEIQAQLAMASGDVARTGGSTANQIKTMNAAVEELQVAVGQKLLPQLTPLITVTAELVTMMANAAAAINVSAQSTQDFVAGLRVMAGYVSSTTGAIAGLADTIGITGSRLEWLAGKAFAMLSPLASVINLIERVGAARRSQDRANSLGVGVGAPDFSTLNVGAELAAANATKLNAPAALPAVADNMKKIAAAARGAGSSMQSAADKLKELNDQLYPEEATQRQLAEQRRLIEGSKKLSDAQKAMMLVALEAQAIEPLTDRLFPREAAESELAANIRLIESMRTLTQARKDELIAALETQDFRSRTSKLGDATVSKGLTGQGSLMVLPENTNLTTQQISAQTEAERIIKQTGDFKSAMKVLQDASAKTTTSVGENFTQMADRTLQALDRMVGAIRGGGFFNILSGVLNFGLQLAGIGVFGKGPQQQLAGMRADGGQVNAGRTYLVGERGPELFSPASHGSITPNSKLQGGGMVINVDARGSTDPEAVRQQVERGILEAAPSIVAAAEQRTIATLRRPRLAGAM